MEKNTIHHADWMTNDLPDGSVNLIIADPPYFEVRGDFDFVWDSFDDYLKDVEKWAIECKRLLAENGTLFWYGDAKRIAYAQIIFDKYFNLVNSLVWENTNPHKQQIRFSKGLRSFAPITERILMYSNEVNQTGLERIKLDVNNFQTLRNHFKEMHEWVDVSKRELIQRVGQRVDHCFRYNSTQWDLPTLETFNELIQQFKINEWDSFREYEDLRREYEDLRREYEDLRRPFDNFNNFGDVIHLPNYDGGKYKHPTIKPEALTRALILTCSKEKDLILIPFAGSGTECVVSKKENREFIGFEIDEKYHAVAMQRLSDQEEKSNQTSLF